MMKLSRQDVYWITRRLPHPVASLLKGKTRGSRLPFLAGGFIRACIAREEASDIDLFAASKDLAALYAQEIGSAVHDARTVKTDNAWTVYGRGLPPIQVIHRWTFERPEEAIESFDFTIAQSAIWCEPGSDPGRPVWRSLCADTFYQDLAAHRLVYLHPKRNEDAGGSMLRLLKFYRKGYTAPLDTIGGVIARLQSGVKDNGGWLDERGLAKVLTGLLREVDPLLDPLHVFHDPTAADVAAEGQVEAAPAEEPVPALIAVNA